MAENGKLRTNADAMNKLLRAMQEDLQLLSKDQQALFGAANDTVKGSKGVKAPLEAVNARLKALDGHVRDYAKAARAFAEEGAKELDKKKQPGGKKPGGVFAK